MEKMKPDDAQALERILTARRSVRLFKADMPPKATVEKILQAGLLAPFAGAAGKSLAETRRFFVFTKGTAKMDEANAVITAQIRTNSKKFSLACKLVPYLRKHGQGFAQRLESMARNGVPAFKTAPYFIVVAERKGIPPAQKQSIAHVMQNMWLEATALGLGFQLVSATQTMVKNRAFLSLLGLPKGVYEIDGCVIGYPDQIPSDRIPVALDEVSTWL